uniref:Uncharacterized protein n=1 Tax=Rhizophora mucronata TaxID=61149 RepID=A0A2P2QBK5_RHIMU
MNPSEIKAMKAYPIPTIASLHSFLGLMGYYQKFIKNYGILGKPLTWLLRKDDFR